MNKNANFTGQPIFNQLLNLIPPTVLSSLVSKYDADRYYKKFFSRDHLISMLYCCFHQCKGLREVTTGLLAVHSKLDHLGLHTIPRRSTLADANSRRCEALFGELYHALVKLYYGQLYPDSRLRQRLEDRMYLLDSTTINLFNDVMKGAGMRPVSGKAKGGMKAHTLMSVKHDIPHFILLSEAAKNDKIVFKHLGLQPRDIIVFDKGYNNYYQFKQWTTDGVYYVTRLNTRSSVTELEQKIVSEKHLQVGVRSDVIVRLGDDNNKKRPKVEARVVTYYDAESKKEFEFLTNNTKWAPTTIAKMYKQRWQIELLFKRIKQNYPLKYFLGESDNAIKIQMWCALIADLLVKVVKDKVRRKWSYSNIASIIRLHLMTYINIFQFLENPDNALMQYVKARAPDRPQTNLFSGRGA